MLTCQVALGPYDPDATDIESERNDFRRSPVWSLILLNLPTDSRSRPTGEQLEMAVQEFRLRSTCIENMWRSLFRFGIRTITVN